MHERGRGRESWRRAFRIRGGDRDLDDELAFHFAETVDELLDRGMSREDAEAEARRRFGDESRYRAELQATGRRMARRRRRHELTGTAAELVRFALRSVWRSPVLSAGIVLTLALGIGANATMFSTIDRLLLRAPDHVREPETLKHLSVARYARTSGEWRSGGFAYRDFLDLRDAETLPQVAAYTRAASFLGEGVDARRVEGWAVTGSFWDVLDVRPHVGRFFTEADDDPEGEAVLVLGYETWQRDFGADPSVVGRQVRVGTGVYTVVGVAPRGFTGATLTPADVWLPFHHQFHRVLTTFAGEQVLGRGFAAVNVLVRLGPGATPERVAEQARAVYLAGREERGDYGGASADPRMELRPIHGPRAAGGAVFGAHDSSREASVALWLGGVALLLLVIACANAANLLLARAIRRRRETAIRLALGVSRRRLVALAFTEGIVLALLGGTAALAMTRWGGRALQNTLLPGVEWDVPFTSRVLFFVVGAAALAGLLSAVVPAIQSHRYAVVGALRAMAGGGRSSSPVRHALVGAQAALSVVLLIGAGLFVRSFVRAHATELGFAAAQIVAIEPWFMTDGAFTRFDPDAHRFRDRALERLTQIPGVIAVGRGSPPFGTAGAPPLRATGHDSIPASPGGGPFQIQASPDYLRVLGLDILEGRGIQAIDRPETEHVTVVSRSMARHLWPDESALGKCLYVSSSEACTRVVGVTSDRKVRAFDEATSYAYYVPVDQAEGGSPVLLVRVAGDPARLVEPIKRELTELDSRVRYVRTVDVQGEVVGIQMDSWKLGATLFSAFGLLAAVVAAIGLYSVLAFDVEQHRREIGVRTALGASSRRVVAMFVRRAAILTATGSVVGIGLALLLAPRLQHLLFQTSARDPLTFGGIALLLVLVGIGAAGVPAWRAARVDPNLVLRDE